VPSVDERMRSKWFFALRGSLAKEMFLSDHVAPGMPGQPRSVRTFQLVWKNTVTYYLDGLQRVMHGGNYYPEVSMSLNYTAWFIEGGLLPPGQERTYEQDVDWTFYTAGAALSPQQVNQQVRTLKKKRVKFRDSVPASQPPLESPCNF